MSFFLAAGPGHCLKVFQRCVAAVVVLRIRLAIVLLLGLILLETLGKIMDAKWSAHVLRHLFIAAVMAGCSKNTGCGTCLRCLRSLLVMGTVYLKEVGQDVELDNQINLLIFSLA